jgi:autophagy-related protein 5
MVSRRKQSWMAFIYWEREFITRQHPIGLLYDLQSAPLPWVLTLHFQNFPTDVLLKNPSVDSMQDMFMSMIKEVKNKIK